MTEPTHLEITTTPPLEADRLNDIHQLTTAVARLTVACGLDPKPPLIRTAVHSQFRHETGGDRNPLDQLRQALSACGMRAIRVEMSLREAFQHARDERPMVMRSPQNVVSSYISVVRRGWSRVRVEGLDPHPATLGLGALSRQLGIDPDRPQSWLVVEPDLPAQALTADTGPVHGLGGGHHAPDGRVGEKGDPVHHPSPFQRIKALARLERGDLWSLLGYAVVTGLLYLAVPLAADAMVSNIAFGGQQQVYLQSLVVLALVLGAFLTLHALVRALAFTVIERLQRRLFVRFTADLAVRLPRVQQTEFDRYHGPELTNRFFDIMTLQKAAAQLLLDGLDVLLTFLIGSLVLAFYDWTLFWFDAGLLVLVLLVIGRLGRGGVQTSIEESRAKYATAGWLQQVAMFSTVFKGPGGSDLAAERTEELTRWYLRGRQDHFRILFRQVAGLLSLEVIAAVALLGWGGVLVLRGQLSIGQLVASQLILTATLSAVGKFGKQLETAYDCMTAIDKVGHLVDLPVESEAGEAPRPGSPQGAEVVIQHLDFEYLPHQPVLRGVNLHLRPGARVALVAQSSRGSTTLLDLLYGLREPTAGHIDLDGLDLRHWRRGLLRQHVARVHGDDEIFDGSLLDNVRLGNESIGLAEVRDALAAVGLLRKVQAMKGGITEPISLLGRSLSGTERRQVLLARAIVTQPRLLLLDATLDGFEAEEIDHIVAWLSDPGRPWTLLVVTRDPDVTRRFEHQISLGDDAPRAQQPASVSSGTLTHDH